MDWQLTTYHEDLGQSIKEEPERTSRKKTSLKSSQKKEKSVKVLKRKVKVEPGIQ